MVRYRKQGFNLLLSLRPPAIRLGRTAVSDFTTFYIIADMHLCAKCERETACL